MRTFSNSGRRGALACLAALLCALIAPANAKAQGTDARSSEATPLVLLTRVEGAIGPATTHQIDEALEAAADRNAAAVVLMMNTPGGLVDATREIIVSILGSPVPVIGYVAPSGAHAASAGTYILYATHAAGMAPATNIGAATPIQMGGTPGPGGDFPQLPDLGGDGEGGDAAEGDGDGEAEDGNGRQAQRAPKSGGEALEAKILNDAIAFIRGLAEMRGRNADWAEAAVREAATLTADAALEQNVVEAVAPSVTRLLEAVDGREVEVRDTTVTLRVAGAEVEEVQPSLTTRVLSVVANPNVAFILMLVGVYGLIFEFSNPGGIGPGVIGAICLIIGMYALNQLPLDYAGLALVLLGIAFMVAEVLSPSFGILGIGGLVSFVIGAAMLIDTDMPAYQLSWGVILGSAVVTGLALMLIVGFALRSFRTPVRTGRHALIGEQGTVMDWSGASGHVRVASERWNATAAGAPPPAGSEVEVTAVDGLTLIVKPVTAGGTAAEPHTQGVP